MPQATHKETRLTIADRAKGCLAGLGTGDALGVTLEYTTAAQMTRMAATHTEMTGGGPLGLEPGEVTSNTELAVALGASLVELSRFDADYVALRYLEWFDEAPANVGTTTSEAMREVRRGTLPPETARRVHERFGGRTAGNGTLPRSVPLALFYRKEPDSLERATLAEARITHWDELAGLAGLFQNTAIARLFADETPEAAFSTAQEAVAGRDARLDACLAEVAELRRPKGAPDGYCLDTLHAALWAVLTTDTFEDAVVAAVNLGGDADTTGTVTGAIAGAYYGRGAIPERWLATLAPRAILEDLAMRLVRLRPAEPW